MKTQIQRFFLVLLITSCMSWAETSKVQGDYELHYNVFPSTFISPQVAKTYQITRSKNKGLINVSVLKSSDVKFAVEAKIDLKVSNLLGQSKSVSLKKISETDGAIYYIGTFPVSHRETLNFKVSAQPENSNELIQVNFSKEFFTD